MSTPTPGIAERLANMPWWAVIITVVVLFGLRWILLKQGTGWAKSIGELAESLAVAMALVFLLIRPFLVQAFFIPSASMHPTLLERDHILVNKLVFRFKEPKLGDVIVFKAPVEANQPGDTKPKDFIKRVIGVPGDLVRITPGYVVVGQFQYDHNDLQRFLGRYAPEGREVKVKVRLTDRQVLVAGRPVTNAEIAAAVGDPTAKVKVVPGKVYLNAKAIMEPYIAEDPDSPYPIGGGGTDQEYIVMKNGKLHMKIPKGKLLVMGDNRNDSNDARYWGLLDRKRVLGKAMFIFFPFDRIRWVR